MILSIVTINFNNKVGLNLTLASVIEQTYKDFEHLIIDGGSTDGSVAVIADYVKQVNGRYSVRWLSEPDGGIYNAMNKGIGMAQGEYVQFLNSGDALASNAVVEQMGQLLEKHKDCPFLCGYLTTFTPQKMSGSSIRNQLKQPTLRTFFNSTVNHASTFIRRDLFNKYGLYDESLKIVSDWKWFLQVMVFSEEKPIFEKIHVALFDKTGISSMNLDLREKERCEVLHTLLPAAIYTDYYRWSFSIEQIERVKRYPIIYYLFYFIERVLFKYEKWFKK